MAHSVQHYQQYCLTQLLIILLFVQLIFLLREWFSKSLENYINTAGNNTISCLWIASLFNAMLIKFQLNSAADLLAIVGFVNNPIFILRIEKSEFQSGHI